MNRRGNVFDSMYIIFVLFTLAIVSAIILILVNTTRVAFENDPSVPPEAVSIIQQGDNALPGVFDFWFVLFLVGLPLISAVLAFFNNIHPLFFWVSLLLVLVVVIFGAAYKELWLDLRDDQTLADSMDRLPMTNFVLSNFGIYSFFVFVVIAGGTFVKLRGGGGYI